MNNHEDNIKREFEEAEGLYETVQTESGKVTSLGKTDPKRTLNLTTADDEEVKRLNEMVGHQRLDLGLLPSKGRFYRDDFEIFIRAARVGEIRDFSTIDENNIKDVDEKLNGILINCAKVMYGPQRGSYKDILEEDRIYILLAIRELTFKEGEQKLLMPVTKKSCKNSTCKAQESVELKTSNLQFSIPEDIIEKYYDPENRCYSVATKNYGTITMAPPTIGVMRAITDYVRAKEEKGQPWDKSMLSILPYLQREWRGWSEKEIFAATTSFQGWNSTKYSIIYRLAEQMKIGVKPEMNFPCQSCGEEVTVPLSFPGGIKALFIIPDITSELL
jgi:hypothetical protein